MAYTINRYDGTALATIQDGDSNNTSSSILLVGRNYASYGEYLEENILHILENFSRSTSPSNPLSGQLWYDSSNKRLNVYDGSVFKSLAISHRSPTAPNNPMSGEFWWDTTNDQLKVFNSSDWVLIGPSYSKVDGQSGAIVDKIYDTSNNPHIVIKLMTAGVVDTIISKDSTFTPMVAIPNFSSISAGVNISSVQKMYGTATNAERLNTILATNYARTDITTPFYSLLDVRTDSGVKIGASSLFQINTVAGNAIFENTGANKVFRIRTNVSGTVSDSFTIGTDGLITVRSNPTTALGVSTKGYVDTIGSNVNSSLTQAINANAATLNTNISNVNSSLTQAINSNVNTLDTRITTTNQAIVSNVNTLNTTIGSVNSSLTQAINANVNTLNSSIATVNSTLTQAINSNVASINSSISSLQSTVATKSPLDSPSFIGIPRAPNPPMGNNSTQIATTAFVSQMINASVVNGIGGITSLNSNGIATIFPADNSNGYGYRTVSTGTPSGGSHGDVWYQV